MAKGIALLEVVGIVILAASLCRVENGEGPPAVVAPRQGERTGIDQGEIVDRIEIGDMGVAEAGDIGMLVPGGFDKIIEGVVDIVAVAMDDEKNKIVDRHQQFLVAGIKVVVAKNDIEVAGIGSVEVVVDVATMNITIDGMRFHDFLDFGLLHKMGIRHDHNFHIRAPFLYTTKLTQ